jgi:hypothetical protein
MASINCTEGGPTIQFAGTVTPGTSVRSRGASAAVSGGTWKMSLPLVEGENHVEFVAAKSGQSSSTSVTVTWHFFETSDF